MLHSYNNTYHSSIGITPAEVNVDNEHMVRKRRYPIKPKSHKWKYEVETECES